jgi:hypothetical protein
VIGRRRMIGTSEKHSWFPRKRISPYDRLLGAGSAGLTPSI